ncbi:MAG: phytoene desaturase family protein [Lautropia sp.]
MTIVGAGPGGLATAMLMAAGGADVTVLERNARVGGRSARLELEARIGGRACTFRFDTGPTFFLYPKPIVDVFSQCGFDFWREVDMVRIDPLYELRFLRPDGGSDPLRVWADPERLASAVAAFSPRDARGLRRFMAENRGKLEAFDPVLTRSFDGVRDLADPKVLGALRWLRPWSSLDRDLARHFGDERLRLAFSFQSKYLGMSPYRCPSLFSILSFLEHEHGVWHPIGGCNAVMDAMARLARSAGVRIETASPVDEILFEGRRAVGVRVGADLRRSDAVVVNAEFAQAMRTLVPDRLRRRWTDARIARKKFSCSTFMLYLGIEGEVDLEHHTIALAADYRRNLREIERGAAPPRLPSMYVQNASRTDRSLAPAGHSALYVLVPVGNLAGGVDWSVERERYRAHVVEGLAGLVGTTVHALEARIRCERIVTPNDWADDLGVYRGATFSLAHSLDQMLCWRPHNRFEDLDGVYLVGGGTHPGSGLPVIFEGARITARLLARDLGLHATRTERAGGARRGAAAGWRRSAVDAGTR